MRFIILFCTIFAFIVANCCFATTNDLDPKNYTEKAEIIILDKLEENSKKIELTKNNIFTYRNLEITLESCWMSPKNKNEHLAKILVIEYPKTKRADDKEKKIFHGWIANNNKKISNLKHKLYQIHLFGCIIK